MLRKNQKGFTLVELMIVVVIIGILAALAIPRFMRATTKSKQSEAKGILKQVYTMQHAYRQEKDLYFVTATPADSTNTASFATLGVDIGRNARYQYVLTTTDAGLTTFTCTATATGLDDDATNDVWTIDQTGRLLVVTDDASS